MIDLLSGLRAAWFRASLGARFRDPERDFFLSDDRIQSFPEPQPTTATDGPYLSERGDYLSLHLVGDSVMAVHTLMDRRRPERLVLGYTEIMAGFDRFTASPRTIGMIGLGGGALAKYCYHSFPASRITVAEIHAGVIALRREFSIPEDDARFCVRHEDGAELVRSNPGGFDVLMIDAFDEGGYPRHFATQGFFEDCFQALSQEGVLVVNLSGGDWRGWFRRLDRVFHRRAVLYPCPDGDNVIVFATKGPLPEWTSARA